MTRDCIYMTYYRNKEAVGCWYMVNMASQYSKSFAQSSSFVVHCQQSMRQGCHQDKVAVLNKK